MGGVEEQMECFLRGLRMLVPEQALAIFELDEVCLALRGREENKRFPKPFRVLKPVLCGSPLFIHDLFLIVAAPL